MKRYVTELHRSKKISLDYNVLRAYEIYVQTFPGDTEMSILGAQVAVELKQFDKAARLYHEGANTATDEKMRETALLGEMDAAEQSKKSSVRETAYHHYLQLMPKGNKSFEARYQLAQLSYEQKQWEKAADAFRTLALDKAGPTDLRKKSADLALDALALQKRDDLIEKWAAEFAGVFPGSRAEYEQIARKAMMNQVALTANNQKSSRSDYRDALEKLQSAKMSTASNTEKTLHFKNMSILAEKAGDEKSLILALNGLLAVKSLSNEDREEALARKVGFYEKKMDFKSAYYVALQMKFPKLNRGEKELRLGTLADLATLKPTRHYEAALRSGLSRQSDLSVRTRLINLSAHPVNELKRHQSTLKQNPKVFSEMIAFAFAKQRSTRGLESILKSNSHLAGVRFIQKQPFYSKHQALDKKIASHQLSARNDQIMGRTIKERAKLLTTADQSLAEALKLRDFTATVMALNTVTRENERMVKDLFALPTPKGLKEKELQSYQALLKGQARPFVAKSVAAKQKLAEFWNNQTALTALTSEYVKSRVEVQAYLGREIQILITLAPDSSTRSQLESSLREGQASKRELADAREAVKSNPENTRQIEKLKELETKIGHPLMASYLDGRLSRMSRGKDL